MQKPYKLYFLVFTVLLATTMLLWQGIRYMNHQQPREKSPSAVSTHGDTSQPNLAKAKEVTRLFIENYVLFDSKQPDLYWKRTQVYRSSDFATDENRTEATRSGVQLLQTELKKIRSIESYQNGDLVDSYVEVEVDETFSGNQRASSVVNYHLILIPVGSEWKVKEVEFDGGTD